MEQRKPIISLIVTVYNLEKYLAACLDSILGQSGNDYEIVLINNNSTDNSGNICSDYAARYSKIRYFFLDGESVMWRAHRYGLKKAYGDYVWFIDGDDMLTENAYETVVKTLRKTRTEVLFARFNTFLEGSVASFTDIPYETVYINEHSKDEALEYLIEKQQPVLPTWRLIFSRALYNDIIRHEKFTELMCNAHQDTGFNVFILVSAKSIHYIDKAIYNYRVRTTSISRTDPSKKILAYCKVLLMYTRVAHDLVKTEAERNFTYAYYKQFLFLLSTIVCEADAHWNQVICDDIDNYTKAIDIIRDIVLKKDFFFVDKLISQGAAIALAAHKEYCQNKLSQISAAVKNKGGKVYLAPIGNVGIFLKTALEQQGLIISGFFDNDQVKDGMEIAGSVVHLPTIAAEISANQPITILIGASYTSVPKQLKQQFISLGIPESDLIIIEF